MGGPITSMDLKDMKVDDRPRLGHITIRLSINAQIEALRRGETLSQDWTIEIRSAEEAKAALDFVSEYLQIDLSNVIQKDGALKIDARDAAFLDKLPEKLSALSAIALLKEKAKTKRR